MESGVVAVGVAEVEALDAEDEDDERGGVLVESFGLGVSIGADVGEPDDVDEGFIDVTSGEILNRGERGDRGDRRFGLCCCGCDWL